MSKKSDGLMCLFSILDTDNDGVITEEELHRELRKFGMKEEGIQHFLSHVDLNGDGNITWEEYAKVFELEDQVTDDRVEDALFLALFKQLDYNRDGELSPEEWHHGLEDVCAYDLVKHHLWKQLDINGDNCITLQEFREGLIVNKAPIVNWKAIFDEIDADKSGDISVAELKAVFDRVGFRITAIGIKHWIQQHDRNKDGKLDYEEFRQLVLKQCEIRKFLRELRNS